VLQTHAQLRREEQAERARTEAEAARRQAAQAPVVIAAAAEPAPAPSFAGDLSTVLKAAKLSQYEDALRELGCAEPEDLGDIEEADLVELGMKKIEMKRLQRIATP
jgi:hypothetical protein